MTSLFIRPLEWFANIATAAGARDRSRDWTPEMIPGGRKAPELFMKPVDVAADTIMTGWLQLKADGISAGQYATRIVTGQGGPFNAARHCLPGLLRMQERIGRPSMIVGEYVEEDGHDATMAAFKRGQGTGTFWAYDVVPLDEWKIDRCRQEIEERLAILEDAVKHADSGFVGMLKPELIEEPYLTTKRVGEIWGMGWEGAVVKKRRSPYVRRRSADWVRFKEIVTKDVLIVEFCHGTNGLKLVCKDPAHPMPPIVIASGWSATEAREIELMERLAPGERWIEIIHNKKAGSGEARHARFHRIRIGKRS